MRNFVKRTLDRIQSDMTSARSGLNGYHVQPFTSFQVPQGHHIGRMLVKLFRGEGVLIDKAMIEKLLWRRPSNGRHGMVPAHFSKVRHAIFSEALTGQPLCELEETFSEQEQSDLEKIELSLEGNQVVLEYCFGQHLKRVVKPLVDDQPLRTHYSVEVDGIAPIAQAIVTGDREIIVHVKSLFGGDRVVDDLFSHAPTALVLATLEMLLHTLMERHGNTVSYQGKEGSLALKHLIFVVLRHHDPMSIRVRPTQYMSTSVDVLDRHGEEVFGLTVDRGEVMFTVVPTRPVWLPELKMPTRYDWVTACSVSRDMALRTFQEGSEDTNYVIGKVDIPFQETGHRMLPYAVLVVVTETRVQVISIENGKVLFSAACQTKPDPGASCCAL